MKTWKKLNWLQKGIILGLTTTVLIQLYIYLIEQQSIEWKGVLGYTATMCFAFSGMAWLASGRTKKLKSE